MTHLTTDFYRQNEWANLALMEACRDLTDDQLDTSAEGTFGTIRDTFRHIISAEAGYASRLGHAPTTKLGRNDPWPGFDVLAEMASAAADALVAAGRDGLDRVVQSAGDKPWDIEAAVILVQGFHHSTEHRSQICTVLTKLGIETPGLSSWDWGEATGRMRKA